MFKDNRYPFSMSELYAGSEGMKCEHSKECTNRTGCIFLTAEEWHQIWLYRDKQAELFILENKLGVALCSIHCKM